MAAQAVRTRDEETALECGRFVLAAEGDEVCSTRFDLGSGSIQLGQSYSVASVARAFV
jgi:hypothetical protein